MLAPKRARPQTKAAAISTSTPAHQHPTLVAHRAGYSSVEQALFLQRTIGNQATLRALTDRLSSPETPAIAEAIRQATVENGTTTPPTGAAFSAALARVNMRTDASADRSARLLGAEAVAFGDHILFRSDRYEPRTERGRALIAHELTHVAHQGQTGHPHPQCRVSGDVLSKGFTQGMAEEMTSEELDQQIHLLWAHLQKKPDDAGAKANLFVLGEVFRLRQEIAQRRSSPAEPSPAPAPATTTPEHGAPAPSASVAPLPPELEQSEEHQKLMGAITNARWQQAAELLNSYNAEGTRAVLSTLNQRQIESLHLGALANHAVGGGSQVAEMTLAAAPALAAANAAVLANGITLQEFSDFRTMAHGDVMNKHGVLRFFQIRKSALALPQSVLDHVLPAAKQRSGEWVMGMIPGQGGFIGPQSAYETHLEDAKRASRGATLDALGSSVLANAVHFVAPLITDDPEQRDALIQLSARISGMGSVIGPIAFKGASQVARKSASQVRSWAWPRIVAVTIRVAKGVAEVPGLGGKTYTLNIPMATMVSEVDGLPKGSLPRGGLAPPQVGIASPEPLSLRSAGTQGAASGGVWQTAQRPSAALPSYRLPYMLRFGALPTKEQPPADHYDAAAWNAYYARNPGVARSLSSASVDDPNVNEADESYPQVETTIGKKSVVESTFDPDGSIRVTYGDRSTTISLKDETGNNGKLMRGLAVTNPQATRILQDLREYVGRPKKLLISFAWDFNDPKAFLRKALHDPTGRWESDAFGRPPGDETRLNARIGNGDMRLSKYALVFEEEFPGQFTGNNSRTTKVTEYQVVKPGTKTRIPGATVRPIAVVRVESAAIVEIVDHAIPGPPQDARAKLMEIFKKHMWEVNLDP